MRDESYVEDDCDGWRGCRAYFLRGRALAGTQAGSECDPDAGLHLGLGGRVQMVSELPHRADELTMVKNRGRNDPYENYALEARVVTVPVFASDEAFLAAVKKGKFIYRDPDHKVVKDEVRLFKKGSSNCVLSFTTAEELKEAPAFGVGIHHRFGKMMFDLAGITCREKADPTQLLDVSYSLRYYPNEGDPAFVAEAEKLAAGIAVE
jgi:hypothetical protein